MLYIKKIHHNEITPVAHESHCNILIFHQRLAVSTTMIHSN